MKDMNALLAGFGGQGILFMGKVIAYAGLTDGKEVSWLPSYGPEMRGGTANCSVCISSDPICSPLVVTPNVFVAMNGPSYDKFIDSVVPGGIVILDSTLVEREVKRDDITVCLVPATQMAEEHGLKGLAFDMVSRLQKPVCSMSLPIRMMFARPLSPCSSAI